MNFKSKKSPTHAIFFLVAILIPAMTAAQGPTAALDSDFWVRPPTARPSAPMAEPTATTDDARETLPAAAWAAIEQAIERDRYQAVSLPTGTPVTTGEEAVLSAPNHAQGFTTRFTGDGIGLRSPGSETEIDLRLVACGYPGHMQKPAAGEPTAVGQRVEIVRGPLTEWYVNRPTGLEQGFTLAERLPGQRNGLLRLELAVNGAVASPSADGEAVLLAKYDSASRLRYAGLKSWDAEGMALASTLGVADQTIVLEIDDAEAVYPLTIDPTITEDAKLLASDAQATQAFGFSVAITDATVVVGAIWDDDGGIFSGSAYIFEQPIGGWSGTLNEMAKLAASDVGEDDLFGFSVAVSGTTVVVGSLRDDDGGDDSGAAYVFEKPIGGWLGTLNESAKLTASDAEIDAFFGGSVAVSSTAVVVGAYQHNEVGFDSGSAYIFEKPNSGWAGTLNETAKLAASDAAAFDRFGFSVAFSGTTVVVGAPFHKDSGSAYIFEQPTGGWAGTLNETAKLVIADAASVAELGVSVAISGAVVVAGDASDDDSGPFSGSAYVFEEPVNGWAGTLNEAAKLTASDAAAFDRFGEFVAISGTTVVVSASDDDDAGTNSGSAYVFEQPLTGWAGTLNEAAKLTASDAATLDEFGSVAISDTVVVVGAFRSDQSVNNSGAAYVFTLAGGGATGDLAVTLDDGLTTTGAGDLLSYVLTATNAGPDAVGATVTDTFPPLLEACTWTCTGSGGGSCQATGTGNIDQLVDLPAAATVSFDITCRVAAGAAGTLSNTATVAVAAGVVDPDPSNNSATDADTLVEPVLRLPDSAPVAEGQLVTVAVDLQGAGLDLGGVGFSIDFDQACLLFDPEDANGDLIPDAIAVLTPAGFATTIFVDPLDTDGEIDVAIADFAPPITALPDGALIEVTFRSTCVPAPQTSVFAPLLFSTDPAASLSDLAGQDVAGGTRDGAVEIHPGPRGDCNGTGSVTVADVVGSGLEIVDGDGDFWADTVGGSFLGSPVGCDANADRVVQVADLVCTNRLLFSLGCGSPGPAGTSPGSGPGSGPGVAPALMIDGDGPLTGQTLVSVELVSPGIAGVAFSIDLDPAFGEFDATDADEDGVPDAVVFPAGRPAFVTVQYDPDDRHGELKVVLADLSGTTLPLGPLVEIRIRGFATGQVVDAVSFGQTPLASFSNPLGQNVPASAVVIVDGVMQLFRDGFEAGDLSRWSTTDP